MDWHVWNNSVTCKILRSGPIRLFLWGNFKNVYADPSINVQDLKKNISNNLSENQLKVVTSREFLRRMQSCIEHQGGNVEQFIR